VIAGKTEVEKALGRRGHARVRKTGHTVNLTPGKSETGKSETAKVDAPKETGSSAPFLARAVRIRVSRLGHLDQPHRPPPRSTDARTVPRSPPRARPGARPEHAADRGRRLAPPLRGCRRLHRTLDT